MTNIEGTPNFDFLRGTVNSDTIRGLIGNDTLQGFAGNDLLFGNQGNDLLQGDEAGDTLAGGQGADTLEGGLGNDWMSGDKGQDVLVAGEGRDVLIGGAGDDLFIIDRTSSESLMTEADEIADFGNGNDQIVLTNGLKFSDLRIEFANNSAILIDRVTGKYLGVLPAVETLSEFNFTALVSGLEIGQVLPISTTATISGRTIGLEVARTPVEQTIGLMGRTELAADRGMLFPVDPPRIVNLWMKNVPINLDMIFLRDGIVQAIFANVPPCTAEPCPLYGSGVPVDAVIELRGGRAGELGLKVGDQIPNLPQE